MRWKPGQAVVRREILGGDPWLGWMVNVVEDTPDLLATYSPPGSPFHFPVGDWPTEDGRHPWYDYGCWLGQGTLMLQRPEDHYAVWHSWDGPGREFSGWYVNLESPFARTGIGFDTQDFELDIVMAPDRTWALKDVELLWQRHAEGRFTLAEVHYILDLGDTIGQMLDSGSWWWEDAWTAWSPDPEWTIPTMPAEWHSVATPMRECCVPDGRPQSIRGVSRPRSGAPGRARTGASLAPIRS